MELEPHEIAGFPKLSPEAALTDEIVFYETVPGGAGYVEEMARRLPEVAAAARKRLFGHTCMKGYYLCLKHYFNQRWHNFFDKSRIYDLLYEMSFMDSVDPIEGTGGEGNKTLNRALSERQEELKRSAKTPGSGGPQSPIEALLLNAIKSPVADYSI